ncbi:MAG: thiamine phosphate synthase [Alphaproteobacteria bacterium]|nr:thiamine phosphate synthase [Alphaproteobacteria bacterium]MBM3952728.1 thiamine phosphate synthase [Rhodospirillales bacterium]
MADARTRLYLITPPKIVLPAFADAFKAALDGGDVAAAQLRLKDADDDTIKRAAETLLPIARERGVTFIMNDRPDLAAATGCDGVHIGQEDASYEEARKALGDDGVVGVTCHDSRHLAIEAAEKGADYIAFGAFFPTGTKEPKTRADVDLLAWCSEVLVVPCVAIGGITPANCAPLVRAGADFLAVVSAVWDHPDGPAAAVKEFNEAIAAA